MINKRSPVFGMLDLKMIKVVFTKELNPAIIGVKATAEIVEVFTDSCEASSCIYSVVFAVKSTCGNFELN